MRRRILKTFFRIFSGIALCLMITSFTGSDQGHWFCDDLKYTYQIEVHNSRKQISVSADLCQIIRSSRKKSDLSTIQLDSNIFLKIFSEDQIRELDAAERSIKEIIYL
ncbi:MAG: hypothetical protein ACK46O_02275 [Flavobacteriia bacterium]|jgi:hypothetical protein